MALLSLQNIHKAFGAAPLLNDATLQIERGERICLVGRNGEGKSTLLKIVNGDLEPDEGEIIRHPGLKVRRLRQNVPTDIPSTVEELVFQGLEDQCFFKFRNSAIQTNAIIRNLDPVCRLS